MMTNNKNTRPDINNLDNDAKKGMSNILRYIFAINHFLLLLIICLLSYAFYNTPALAAKRALLIGIEAYPAVPRLLGPKNDVGNMSQFIQKIWGYQPNEIKTLIDAQATKKGIITTMNDWLLKNTSAGDDVLFYYSGHGYQSKDRDGDEEDELDETLVAYDARSDGSGSFRNMVTDDEINKIFNKISDRKLTVVIDSCHSGTVTRGLVPSVTGMNGVSISKTPGAPLSTASTRSVSKSILDAHRAEESFIKGTPNRTIWTAVSSAQKALIDLEATRPGSMFTNRLIDGIGNKKADSNGNGVVSNAELLDYLREESNAFCKRNEKHCPLGLTPTLEASKDIYIASVTPEVTVKPAISGSDDNDTPQAKPTSLVNSRAEQNKMRPVPEKVESTIELAHHAIAHSNTANVMLELLPTVNFKVGDPLTLRVTSPRSGYLVLLDIDTTGQLTQLFPNRYSDKAGKSNYIEANRPVHVPDPYYGFKLTATEPVGSGYLIAIVTEDQVDLSKVVKSNKDLKVISNPKAYLAELASELRKVWRGDTYNREAQWSYQEKDYYINK